MDAIVISDYALLGLEECSHHIRYADDCPECERVWDEAYPPTISKAAYDGARVRHQYYGDQDDNYRRGAGTHKNNVSASAHRKRESYPAQQTI